jgi:hypothetical protein
MKSILFILFAAIPSVLLAQEGSLVIVQDSGVRKVLNLYETFAKEKRVVNGYRVQLGANSNRQPLLDLKAQFLQSYPETTAYIVYQQPQFKLRVGDFKNRNQAAMFMSELQGSFPAMFIVPDKIYVEGVEW